MARYGGPPPHPTERAEMMTHYEVEQLYRIGEPRGGRWFPISMPGSGGIALQFPTLAAAQSRYAGRQFRFVRVVDPGGGDRHDSAATSSSPV